MLYRAGFEVNTRCRISPAVVAAVSRIRRDRPREDEPANFFSVE
jgi:hypothetical protein